MFPGTDPDGNRPTPDRAPPTPDQDRGRRIQTPARVPGRPALIPDGRRTGAIRTLVPASRRPNGASRRKAGRDGNGDRRRASRASARPSGGRVSARPSGANKGNGDRPRLPGNAPFTGRRTGIPRRLPANGRLTRRRRADSRRPARDCGKGRDSGGSSRNTGAPRRNRAGRARRADNPPANGREAIIGVSRRRCRAGLRACERYEPFYPLPASESIFIPVEYRQSTLLP